MLLVFFFVYVPVLMNTGENTVMFVQRIKHRFLDIQLHRLISSCDFLIFSSAGLWCLLHSFEAICWMSGKTCTIFRQQNKSRYVTASHNWYTKSFNAIYGVELYALLSRPECNGVDDAINIGSLQPLILLLQVTCARSSHSCSARRLQVLYKRYWISLQRLSNSQKAWSMLPCWTFNPFCSYLHPISWMIRDKQVHRYSTSNHLQLQLTKIVGNLSSSDKLKDIIRTNGAINTLIELIGGIVYCIL